MLTQMGSSRTPTRQIVAAKRTEAYLTARAPRSLRGSRAEPQFALRVREARTGSGVLGGTGSGGLGGPGDGSVGWGGGIGSPGTGRIGTSGGISGDFDVISG
jgi:hypothetical protein